MFIHVVLCSSIQCQMNASPSHSRDCKFRREVGRVRESQRPNIESQKLNWNFKRGGGGGLLWLWQGYFLELHIIICTIVWCFYMYSKSRNWPDVDHNWTGTFLHLKACKAFWKITFPKKGIRNNCCYLWWWWWWWCDAVLH